jgi:hypothetical protein
MKMYRRFGLARQNVRSRFALVPLTGIVFFLCWSYHAFAIDLVHNGSFEEGAPPPGGGPILGEWDDGPRQGNDIGFSDNPYTYFLGGEIESGSAYENPPNIPEFFTGFTRPLDGGMHFGNLWGYGNGTGHSGSATQFIDVSRFAGTAYEFSAWLASRRVPNDLDYATVELELFDGPDATGSSLGTIYFDGNDQMSPFIVGSLNIEGFADSTIPATQDNWTFYRARGVLPAFAVSASITIRGQVPAGSLGNGSDAYVDLVSFQVVPEPPSLLLLVMALIPLVFIWFRAASRSAYVVSRSFRCPQRQPTSS